MKPSCIALVLTSLAAMYTCACTASHSPSSDGITDPDDAGARLVPVDANVAAPAADASTRETMPLDASTISPSDCAAINLGRAIGERVAIGTLRGRQDLFSSGCGGPGPDIAYRWKAPHAGAFVIDTVGTGWDTVLHVRLGNCDGLELGCNDDVTFDIPTSVVRISADPSTEVVIIIDSVSARDAGTFVLNILEERPEQCDDGVDNDRDGWVDCEDASCVLVPACHETDCHDGIDNNMNGALDCDDHECNFDPECIERLGT